MTAAIYNADHVNHITYNTPAGLDDYSATVSEMQVQTDPGEIGSESQATSTAGELERLRFALAEMKGTSYWYESANGALSDPSGNHLLYNTTFEIWQEGTSRTDAASALVRTDGWNYTRVAGGAGRVTVAQETSVLPTVAQVGSFVRACMSITVTTADNSIAAGDYYHVYQSVEGYYAQAIVRRNFTLSFWVRAAVTGTYCVGFTNSVADKSYVAEYTISSANTWEYKTVLVTASPSAGTWDYTTGIGLNIVWTLAAGSTFQTAAGGWTSGNYFATASQANLMGTISNTFYLAAPKITPGPTASRWLPISAAVELSRCQRYLEKSYPLATVLGTTFTSGTSYGGFYAGSAANINANIKFAVCKRDTPGLTTYDAAGAVNKISYYNAGWSDGGALDSSALWQEGFWGRVIGGGITAIHFQWVADARL